MQTKVGILAGFGRLPVVVAREARRAGYAVAVVSITPTVEPELAANADELRSVPIGQWQQIIDALHEMGVRDLYLLGKVKKEWLFSNISFDARFMSVVASLSVRNDDSLMLAFVNDLEREGITVRRQDQLVPGLMPPAGVLSRRQPTQQELADVAYGYSIAKGIAGLDVGQTCVVKHGAVLAVEAIDGTDACIRRGGELGRGDTVVVKVAKPHQDMRFDLPVVGLDTVKTVVASGGRVLAFQAGLTFLLDREEALQYADEHELTVVAYDDKAHNQREEKR